jgi:hypothetical protein
VCAVGVCRLVRLHTRPCESCSPLDYNLTLTPILVDWVLVSSQCIRAANGRNEEALPELDMLQWPSPPQSSSNEPFFYLDVSSHARSAKRDVTFAVDHSLGIGAAQLLVKFEEVRCRRGGARSGSGPEESQGQVVSRSQCCWFGWFSSHVSALGHITYIILWTIRYPHSCVIVVV